MAKGDQSGWNDLTYVDVAATWGQDMEVLDIILYLTLLESIVEAEGKIIGEYAAKMSIHKADISG